jgi:hypothetical protein
MRIWVNQPYHTAETSKGASSLPIAAGFLILRIIPVERKMI